MGARQLDGHSGGLGAGSHVGQVEYAYHLMALDADVTMARCELLAEGDRRHFITRHFDRDDDGTKTPVVSLCGIAHLDFNQIGAHGYDQYFDTIDRLGLDVGSRQQAYRRMVLNIAAANCDDHTKNVAFVRRAHSGRELAPAYDVTFAHDPGSIWTRQHLMSVNGGFSAIGLDDLYAVAARHGVPAYKAATREVLAAVDRWRTRAASAGLDDAQITAIADVLAAHRPT